jgi:hypothetical protein
VTFEKWEAQVSDTYNWEQGLEIPLSDQLFGGISDDDFLCMERNGYGKSYEIESDIWSVDWPMNRSFYLDMPIEDEVY